MEVQQELERISHSAKKTEPINNAVESMEMPTCSDAEQSLLASIIIDNKNFHEVDGQLEPKDFSTVANAKIFAALVRLIRDTGQADLVTLRAELKREKAEDEVGGVTYLSSLLDCGTGTAVAVKHYAKLIKKKSALRALIQTHYNAMLNCYDAEADPAAISERSLASIEAIKLDSGLNLSTMDTVAFDHSMHMQHLQENPGQLLGISSGHADIDDCLLGFQPGLVYIIGGRPSEGKTAICGNWFDHACKLGKRPVFFSLEQSKRALVTRSVSRMTGIDSKAIQIGALRPDQWRKVYAAEMEISQWKGIVNDTSNLTAGMIRTAVRQLKTTTGCDLVIIDYLQIMRHEISSHKTYNQNLLIQETSSALKEIAKTLHVPLLVISQLNRGAAQGEPDLENLRDCGAIEQDADIVGFVWKDKDVSPAQHYFSVKKHRDGGLAKIRLTYNESTTLFENAARFQ